MIKSRLVLYFPGFETLGAQAQIDRRIYCDEKSSNIWNLSYQHNSTSVENGEHCLVSNSSASGDGWNTNTRFVLMDWSDIASSFINSPYPANFAKYIFDFLAFFLDGTTFRYFKTSKRFWLYSIFPLVLILAFIIIGWMIADLIVGLVAPDAAFWVGLIYRIAITVIIATALCKWPGDRFFLGVAINMSGFLRDIATGRCPAHDERCNIFADILAKEIGARDYDEILVVGHSIGVTWGLVALSKALNTNPDLLVSTRTVFLALGSNLPRTALVSSAQYLRDHLKHVMGFAELFWHEFQSKDDLVSFYKADPIKILGVMEPRADYLIDRVRFKKALHHDRYLRIRKSFYRTHLQYVLPYDRPVYFDFAIRCIGPFSSRELAFDDKLIDKIALKTTSQKAED